MQDLILDAVRVLGPVGVGLLMLLENLFPPIPSELIMPLAGTWRPLGISVCPARCWE